MAFKHGRLGEIWFNGVDISPYFASADFSVKVDTADVTTFKNTWKQFITGDMQAVLTASGYYDSADADKVRDVLTNTGAAASPVSQLTYAPAGALAIGDPCRVMNAWDADYVNRSQISTAIIMDWTAQATAPIGFGSCLHVLQQEAVGTVTGAGDGLQNGGVQTTTGLIANLHVTAMTGGDTHNFKLQDATTVNGVYADIVGGAFTNVTAVGSQRLIVPGTIRQFVHLVATINGHAATYACAVART